MSTSKYLLAPELSPTGEEDELSVLGGKTRLVSKKETLSPVFTQRSPISHTPVVPLPLSPGALPQNVLDYLQSFRPSVDNVQQHATAYASQQFPTSLGNSSFDPVSPHEQTRPSLSVEMTQSSFYSTQPAFGGNAMSSYLPHQPGAQQTTMDRGVMPLPPPQQNLADTSVRENDMAFPQYLPVYDYGLASASYINGSDSMFGTDQSLSVTMDTTPSTLVQQQRYQPRRSSDSPDGSMQTMWFEFVNSMGCAMGQ